MQTWPLARLRARATMWSLPAMFGDPPLDAERARRGLRGVARAVAQDAVVADLDAPDLAVAVRVDLELDLDPPVVLARLQLPVGAAGTAAGPDDVAGLGGDRGRGERGCRNEQGRGGEQTNVDHRVLRVAWWVRCCPVRGAGCARGFSASSASGRRVWLPCMSANPASRLPRRALDAAFEVAAGAGRRRHRPIRHGRRRGCGRGVIRLESFGPARRSPAWRRRAVPARVGDQADRRHGHPPGGRGRPAGPGRADLRGGAGSRPGGRDAVHDVARAHPHQRPRRRRRRGAPARGRRPRRAPPAGRGVAPGDAAGQHVPLRVDDVRPPGRGPRAAPWPDLRRPRAHERAGAAGDDADDVRSRVGPGGHARAGPRRPRRAGRRPGGDAPRRVHAPAARGRRPVEHRGRRAPVRARDPPSRRAGRGPGAVAGVRGPDDARGDRARPRRSDRRAPRRALRARLEQARDRQPERRRRRSGMAAPPGRGCGSTRPTTWCSCTSAASGRWPTRRSTRSTTPSTRRCPRIAA